MSCPTFSGLGGQGDLDRDLIDQRPADPAEVAAAVCAGARTAAWGVSCWRASAWGRGEDEPEPGEKNRCLACAGERDLAAFQRLPHAVQHLAAVFRCLVEVQDPVMGPGG